MSEFTKGDLEVDCDAVFDSSGSLVTIFSGNRGNTEDTANAHLFAVANKMYAKLVECQSEMHGLINEVNDQRASKITSQTEDEPDYHDQQTLQEIEELLKAARGES